MKRDLCTAEIEAWELGEARHSRARVLEAHRQVQAPTSAAKVAVVIGIALPLLIAGVVALVRHLVRS